MPTTWRPIVEKLYKKQEDIRAALKRHLVFFNTQPGVGGVIHGIVIAMEEERAAGLDISGDAINGIKTGLMGPMAGIGDTLQRGIVIPIALRAGHRHRHRRRCRDGGAGEHPGPALLRGRVAAFIWGVGWWVWWQGYVRGGAQR